MSTKVYELAKELNISSKEMIEKLNKMGIEVKSHMNVVNDVNCIAVRNAMKNKAKPDETTIVKVEGKNKSESAPKKAAETKPVAKKDSANAEKKTDKPNKKQDNHKQNAVKKERNAQGEKSVNKTESKNFKNKNDAVKSEGKRHSRDDGHAQHHRGSSKDKKQDAGAAKSGNHGQQKSNERRNKNGQDKDKTANNNKSKILNIAKPKHSGKKDKEARKAQRKEDARKAELEAEAIPVGAIIINVPITVKGLSEQIDVSTSQIIMTLMKMGIMANINQNLDEDVVEILADELDKKVIIGHVENESDEEGIEDFDDREEDLKPRPPIITVMGHVDHGKTSLLDRIRKTSVTASESGGITQHIGASEITYKDHRIVFLDTPGHEAFTAMRARGAYVTDIAVLVVAADDSVKPQTIEAINHAKAANVPIIVAINKIDKPGANVDKVKKDLADQGVLIEEWGGEVICVPVSAKTGEGLDNMLEMILLEAEMLELRANPNRLGMGTVIEARLDKQKGAVATLLVLNGTLHVGQALVAGNCSGRVKAMTNFTGKPMKKAGPATAVEILGLTEVAEAGDQFNAVRSDKIARDIADNRKLKLREQVMQKSSGVTLEQLFSRIEQGEVKELNLIVKADVQGSVGALVNSLEKLSNDNVAVNIIHPGVGTINESDVMLASTTQAIIIGFNVRPSSAVSAQAQHEDVEIRTYRVIYEALEEVEAAMQGMLDPEYKEEVTGTVEVRNTFKVPNAGMIAGGYVTDGKIERNVDIRLLRDGIVIHEGKVSSLRRFKDDVKEVSKGYECGVGIENYNDVKDGDVIEAYKMVEIERK